MANEEVGVQGEKKGYSDDDVEVLLNETAKRAANEAIKNIPKPREENEGENELIGISPKLVKQLQTTVSVFNTLKEFSSNPLQRAIETKVGDLAAGVIENAFSRPSGPPPKRDLIDTILNSQFAFGLGNGLGQRAPELVESMGRTFGSDRAGQMIDNVIGQYGKGGKQLGQNQHLDASPGIPSGPSGNPVENSGNPSTGQKSEKQQTEKELLLSLDPNNPEHVAAYAESQGGISVDVARKMLMIHQDEFINQMKKQGDDVSQLSTMRGSHVEKTPPIQQQAEIKNPEYKTDARPEQIVPEIRTEEIYQQEVQKPIDQQNPGMNYTEFQDLDESSPTTPTTEPNSPNPEPPQQPPGENIQQTEALKLFAQDVGKIMEDVITKIESLNNTVFVLKNELNEIKANSNAGLQIPHTDAETGTITHASHADADTETIPHADVDTETIPHADVDTETIPHADVDTETIPQADVETIPHVGTIPHTAIPHVETPKIISDVGQTEIAPYPQYENEESFQNIGKQENKEESRLKNEIENELDLKSDYEKFEDEVTKDTKFKDNPQDKIQDKFQDTENRKTEDLHDLNKTEKEVKFVKPIRKARITKKLKKVEANNNI